MVAKTSHLSTALLLVVATTTSLGYGVTALGIADSSGGHPSPAEAVYLRRWSELGLGRIHVQLDVLHRGQDVEQDCHVHPFRLSQWQRTSFGDEDMQVVGGSRRAVERQSSAGASRQFEVPRRRQGGDADRRHREAYVVDSSVRVAGHRSVERRTQTGIVQVGGSAGNPHTVGDAVVPIGGGAQDVDGGVVLWSHGERYADGHQRSESEKTSEGPADRRMAERRWQARWQTTVPEKEAGSLGARRRVQRHCSKERATHVA